MNCPYCNIEMEVGLIQSAHELSWFKGTKRHFFAKAEFHKDSLVLSELSFWKGSAVKAFLCRACGKIIIDVADSASDFNAE